MNYFYQKGIDITNDKQMFNFLKDHYQYYTMNSWNRTKSIANNVKLYKLGLSGDWTTVLDFLNNDDYFTINMMIEDWEAEHSGYKVGFNGRSGGYLVLHNAENTYGCVLSDDIDECEDYEEYKRFCKEYYGSVKENRRDLVEMVKLVQDFDKLCDQLRDYCDELSKRDFKKDAMEEAVDLFNEHYYDDLCYVGFDELVCEDGVVNIEQISELTCLVEAFLKIADKRDLGYKVKVEGNFAKLVEK